MRTKIQHILACAAALSMMVLASSAHASVKTKGADLITAATPNLFIETNLPVANQSITKFVQNKISASQAKKIARSRVRGGEVVDINLRGNTYRVRVIAKNGRVVDVFIDARTGRVK